MIRQTVPLITLALAGCAGVTFSSAQIDNSIPVNVGMPGLKIARDENCQMSVEIITLPGPPKYAQFRSGLGESNVTIELGAGNTIKSINVETKGQAADALELLKLAGGLTGVLKNAPNVAPKGCATVEVYPISYDAAGLPSVNWAKPVLQLNKDQPS